MKLMQREGFSLITALIIIVLMATVAMLIFNLSGKMVKSTTTQFQREQAMLYAKSYTEYAVLAVMANDRNATGTCVTTINSQIGPSPSTGDGYRARMELHYIGSAAEVNSCAGRILDNNVVNRRTPLSVLIDVYVDYKEPDDPNGAWRTYHKRSLQKI